MTLDTYLKQQGLAPLDLLTADDLKPPDTMVRILIEPEQLANLPKGAWSIQHWAGASGGGGLTVPQGARGAYLPLRLVCQRAGTYRLWVRHYTFADSAGLISKLSKTASDSLAARPTDPSFRGSGEGSSKSKVTFETPPTSNDAVMPSIFSCAE